jgi:MSHA pilin protein MshC
MGRNGFTLIELVIILVLIGIIALFVAPRMLDVTSTKASVFADKLRADIRTARNLAMTENRRYRVFFNGAGLAPAAGYAVARDSSALGNCGSFAAAPDPALTGNLIVTLNAGDYAGITVAPAVNCLEYDALGRPYDCSASPATCSTTSAGMIISVNANGNPVETVTVTPQTGAVN